MLYFRLISFTVFPGIGIPLLFQVIHPDCADFGIAAQSLDTAAVFDTVIGIGLAYGMGFKCYDGPDRDRYTMMPEVVHSWHRMRSYL